MRRMFSEKQIEGFVKNTKKDIATLVDANGNDRFVGGDIVLDEKTGITQTYGKWSLSGSHLLIVIAFNVADTTVLTFSKACDFTIPEWIHNKIAVISQTDYVERNNVYLFADDQTSQSSNMWLRKGSSNKLSIYYASLTLTKDRTCRCSFDLLID